MSGALPLVVYIGGYSRSGSTLLDVMLASALGAFGGGELSRLVEDWPGGRCSCGLRYPDCAFWGDLELDRADSRRRAARMIEGRSPVDRILPGSRRRRELHLDTIRRVFDHIGQRSAAEIVVDSSKSARAACRRARTLAEAGLDVRFVHLVRSPYGVAGSYARVGSNRAHESGGAQPRARVLRALVGWRAANSAAAHDRALRRWPATTLSYEELVRDPEASLLRLSSDLGLPEPRLPLPDELHDAAGHAVAGNRMRRAPSVVVRRRVVPIVPADLARRHRIAVGVATALAGRHGYRTVGGAVPSARGADLERPAQTGRVVHICTRFAGGGSERRIVDAVAATPELAHTVVTGPSSDPARMAEELGDADIWTVRGLDPRAVTPLQDLRAALVLGRVLRRVAPATMHTVQSKAGVLGRLVAPRTVRSVHSVSMLNFGPAFGRVVSAVSRTAERGLARRTDRMLVAGTDLRDVYVSAGIGRREDYEVVRAGIDIDLARECRMLSRSAARHDLGLPADRPLVVFVGRMERRKGVAFLPAVFERILDHEPDAHIALAGAGPLQDETVEALRRVTTDRGAVSALGRVDDVPRLLRAANCVVLPSLTEGLPQVLAQAAVVGTPFVASDVAGVRELLALGAVGSVHPPGDAAAAGDAVAAWIRADEPVGAFDACSWEPRLIRAAWRRVLSQP